MFVNKYTVEFYNDIDETNEVETGIVLADTYHEAVEKLEHFYGENQLISIEHLEGFDFGEDEVITNSNLKELGYLCSD